MTAKDFDYIIELKNKWLDMAQMVDNNEFDQKAFERLAKETALVLHKHTVSNDIPYEVVCLLLAIKDYVYTPAFDSNTKAANEVAYTLCDIDAEFGIYTDSITDEPFLAIDLEDSSFDFFLSEFDLAPLVEYFEKIK